MEEFIDTHCHIHDSDYDFIHSEVLANAAKAAVTTLVCVGTDLRSSHQAINFCLNNEGCYASFGLHPHLATRSLSELEEQFAQLRQLALQYKASRRLVALGECGLDYFYHRQPEVLDKQRTLFRWHLNLAKELQLPVILHVREAFDDFWPIYESEVLPAVLHSFSDNPRQIERLVSHAQLYCGLNGIMTFSRNQQQLQAAKDVPLSRLVLETDAPYLAPVPYRGKSNQPAYLPAIADFLANLRGDSLSELARQTTANARALFGLDAD